MDKSINVYQTQYYPTMKVSFYIGYDTFLLFCFLIKFIWIDAIFLSLLRSGIIVHNGRVFFFVICLIIERRWFIGDCILWLGNFLFTMPVKVIVSRKLCEFTKAAIWKLINTIVIFRFLSYFQGGFVLISNIEMGLLSFIQANKFFYWWLFSYKYTKRTIQMTLLHKPL